MGRGVRGGTGGADGADGGALAVHPEAVPPVAVLKFGSSVLEGAVGFAAAAAEVAREVQAGRRVVAVVSAPPGATDALLGAAAPLADPVPDHFLSRLLATGESASVALLAIALAARGVEAEALDAEALGLRTCGPVLDADPVDVDAAALRARLARCAAVVVPGFVGVRPDGELSLLGRGGSDLTALFLADRLDAAECRLLKDVDGVHAADPALDPSAPVFRAVTWELVLEVGGALVQAKAVRFARERERPFRVSALGGVGTWVGTGPAGVEAMHATA